MRPHSSNSIENVFSSTSPLASYKAVTLPRPTHPGLILYNQHMFQIQEHNLQNIFFLLQDASILYKTLKSNTFIIGLDLGYNTIGDEGAEIIAQLLQV